MVFQITAGKGEKRKSVDLDEAPSSKAPEAKLSSELESQKKVKRFKSTEEKILEIVQKDKPNQLNPMERKREDDTREERKLNVVLTGIREPLSPKQVLNKLPSAVHRSMGFWVKFKEAQTRLNGDYVLTVESMESKKKILRHKSFLKFYGGSFCNDRTVRELQVERWLNEKQGELRAVGVKAKAMYLGIFIDGYKWIWSEYRWGLIKTNIRFKGKKR